MPRFEIEWAMYGTTVVEADDGDEAEQILHEELQVFNTSMFDEFTIDEISTMNVDELGQDDD